MTTTNTITRLARYTLAPLVFLGACGSDSAPSSTGADPTDPPPATIGNAVTVAATYQAFEYFAGCRNEPVLVDGTLFYPVFPRDQSAIDTSQYPDVEAGAAAEGEAEGAADAPAAADGLSKVAPPRPGDDVGTLVVYSDGMARYESDSGIITWLTDQELTYNWVC